MTDDAVASDAAPAGILQTLRETPTAGRFALLGAFVNQLGAFVQLFLVLYLTTRGFSQAQAGLALGAYAVGAIAGTLFGGAVSDRLGPRWTIAVSMGSTAVFTVAVTVLPSFPAILVAVTLSGVMTQAARPAIAALLFSLVPKSRQTMVFAIYGTAINAGIIAGPLIAAWLSTVSWNLVFWFDAGTSLVYGAIAAFLVPLRYAQPPAELAKEAEAVAPKAGYRTMLRDHRYLAYLAIMLANGLVHIQFYVVLPLMMVMAGYPTWAYGLTTAIAAAIVVGGNMAATTQTQKWPPWLAINAGWVLLVMGRGAYGLPGGLFIIITGTVLAAIGQVVGAAAAFSYPAKVAPSSAVGRYVGSAHAVFQSGYALGPIIGVWLWNSLGHGFWAICFAFGIVMTVPGIWGTYLTGPGGAVPTPRDVDASPAPAAASRSFQRQRALVSDSLRSQWYLLRKNIGATIYLLRQISRQLGRHDVVSPATPLASPAGPGTDVFLVHGHDGETKQTVARFLAKLIGREPIILHEQPDRGRTLIEKFEDHAATAACAVVLLTGDDVGGPAGGVQSPRARQNVVFELGYFIGMIGRTRVVILYETNVELPSVLNGVLYVPIDNAGAWRSILARELRTAGVEPDLRVAFGEELLDQRMDGGQASAKVPAVAEAGAP
jgi:predicted nucleotide-binding protein/predicted MFS family arabinose efflux permease